MRVGPRTAQVRIARTRDIAAHTLAPSMTRRSWAVTCFVVRREHRGTGLTAELLDAADRPRPRSTARASIEAYPVDTAAAKKPSNELYHGVLSVFEAAGFARDRAPQARPARSSQLELSA